MVSLHRNHNSSPYHVFFVSFLLSIIFAAPVAESLGTFGYEIHHRYSDTVKKILGNHGLPEKDTVEYFNTLVHRDHLRGRRLAAGDEQLTFVGGNVTAKVPDLGFLQYVYVKVGTPGRNFLVALDSGSDLFWLPCECTACARNITLRSGTRLDFNIFQLNASSTSEVVTCASSVCGTSFTCLKEQDLCSYTTDYILANTTSNGVLLQDVLKLATNEKPSTSVDASITFGCGLVQTGAFLSTTALNGLLGLGTGELSVPSILAGKFLTSNSFSLCAGPDGTGRIVFGDTGSFDQNETPFTISPPNYVVSVEQVTIGTEVSDLEFTAIFDSGIAFTRLSDPVYTTLTDNFHSQVLDPRRFISNLPFEYCYNLSSTSAGPDTPVYPAMSFTMKGGSQFNIRSPIILAVFENSEYAYCLAVIKTTSVRNTIGLNFMGGLKMAFDRERNVLGWKKSDCYGNDESDSGSSTPPPPRTSNTPPPFSTPTPPPPRTSTPPPPVKASNPPPPPRFSSSPPPPDSSTTPGPTEASPPPPETPDDNTTNSTSQIPATPGFRLPGTGAAAQLNSFTWKVVMAFLSILIHYFIFH